MLSYPFWVEVRRYLLSRPAKGDPGQDGTSPGTRDRCALSFVTSQAVCISPQAGMKLRGGDSFQKGKTECPITPLLPSRHNMAPAADVGLLDIAQTEAQDSRHTTRIWHLQGPKTPMQPLRWEWHGIRNVSDRQKRVHHLYSRTASADR